MTFYGTKIAFVCEVATGIACIVLAVETAGVPRAFAIVAAASAALAALANRLGKP